MSIELLRDWGILNLLRPVRKPFSFLRRRGRFLKRWVEIWQSRVPANGRALVSYGHDYLPHEGEKPSGGIVKFQRLQNTFPNSPRRFNLLYLGSSSLPKDWQELVWLSRRKGAAIIYNQNGVAYPAWCKGGLEKINRPMARLLSEADHVFYQSRFCKRSADLFAGEREESWEILYNAVDTNVFTPAERPPKLQPLMLLMGGTQCQYYRIESSFRAVSHLVREGADVHLLVTGKLNRFLDDVSSVEDVYKLMRDLNITDRVSFTGPYSQNEAPHIFGRAHILLHSQYNDACPTVVLEAMSCGLPVVYSHSGGVPELVGEDAGIGVPAETSWERIIPPDPQELAKAILLVAERLPYHSEAARTRAVEKFDLQPWLRRHKEVFEELVG